MRILGIDPGLATMGWGVIESRGDRHRLVQYGALTTAAGQPMPQRLRAIYPAGILFTGAASILYTVQGLGAAVPVLDGGLSAVPLAEVGLGWVLPALAGVLLGAVLSLQRESKEVR